MNRFIFAILTAACLTWSIGSAARDFTIDDFDPADPANPDDLTQAEAYREAVADLIEELTIIARDDEGYELFRVVPFTLELVALSTQLAIYEGNIAEPDQIEKLVAQANSDKPTANSFAFVLDGDPVWVRRDVSMYYYPRVNDTERIQVPLLPVSHPVITEDAMMVAAWAMMATDAEELEAFLAAPRVVLVVGEEEEEAPIALECGFWRRWALFDLRPVEEEGEVANPPATY